MPTSLRFWEWGCPKRGDAHITVTQLCRSTTRIRRGGGRGGKMAKIIIIIIIIIIQIK